MTCFCHSYIYSHLVICNSLRERLFVISVNINLCKAGRVHEQGLCKLYPDSDSPVTSDGGKGYCRCRIGMGGIAALSAAF